MKKALITALMLAVLLLSQTVAFADISPVPRPMQQNDPALVVVLIVAVVVIAAVILFCLLRRKKKK